MANQIVVLAILKDEPAADTAAETLKESGLARHDAIGVLALNGRMSRPSLNFGGGPRCDQAAMTGSF